MIITFLLSLATLGVWVYLFWARGNFWRISCETEAVAEPNDWPDVCVIIPARNEADILPATLPTLLANGYPGQLHVVLVDDRSEDSTAHVATEIARSNNATGQLSLVTVSAMPSGWKGKVWAMHNGLEQVKALPHTPRYVLFTDADIAYDSGAIARLVAEAEISGLALNSKMVLLRCKSRAERIFIPAFVYFFQMLYPFHWVNDPKRKTAAAAGGCMLMRYDALLLAGGIARIRNVLIDDCALGRQMKRQGKIRLSLTRQIHSLRAYPHIGDIRSMVARSAYDQLDYSPLHLTSAMLGMLLTFVVPYILFFFTGGDARALGLLSMMCMATSFVPITRFYGRSPLMCFALPLIAIFYMAFTLDSAWQHWRGRGGLWKGRFQAQDMQSA